MIEIKNLAVRRGRRQVLADLSLSVARGEIFAILGPNGAGKSTLFAVLTGLLQPEHGTIELEGKAISYRDRDLRARIGVVFQEPALDVRLTLRENLILAADLYGVPRSRARERIEQLTADAEIADRLDEKIATFSGGLRRRAEIARALVHDPEVLILDEPTSGLDEGAFRRTWDQLSALRRERRLTIVLTTHRPDEAERVDRIAVLDAGRIVACDTPERLRALVRGDVIVLETDDPAAVVRDLRVKLGLEPREIEGRVLLEVAQGHAWIPRIVETLGEGTLRSVSLRRPGLGEAFLELTGREIAADSPAMAEAS